MAVLEKILSLVTGAINGNVPSDVETFLQQHARLSETVRFQEMNLAESYWRGCQHDAKKANWDGRRYIPPNERAMSHASGTAEPFSYKKAPWTARRPFVRKQLCAAIVGRFTGLLFGEKRCPSIRSKDPRSQPWVDGALKLAQWWTKMSMARDYGGGMGSVACGVTIRAGIPFLEVENGKYCTPKFVGGDVDRGELESLEILYKRPFERLVTERDPRTGQVREVWKDEWEWYRRVLTTNSDVVLTAPLKQGLADPSWTVATAVEHGLGFVPWVWIRNTEVVHELDGAPDCDQQWDNFDGLDALLSDTWQGTHYNSDPTMVITTMADVGTVETGSGTCIKLSPSMGGQGAEDVKILELSGTASETTAKRAAELADSILQDTSCVLDEGQATGRSATELVKRTEAMFERADKFRRLYGDAIERLFELLLKVVRKSGPRNVGIGVLDPSLFPSVDDVDVTWPEYVQTTPQDKEVQVRSLGLAVTSKLLSQETGIKVACSLFGVTDIDEERRRIKGETEKAAEEYSASLAAEMEKALVTAPPAPVVEPEPPEVEPEEPEETPQ